MTKNQAIREARSSANAIIEQLTRWANGWDKGAHRDDTMPGDRCWMLSPGMAVRKESEHAFALSKQFA